MKDNDICGTFVKGGSWQFFSAAAALEYTSGIRDEAVLPNQGFRLVRKVGTIVQLAEAYGGKHGQ